jgi:xylulokinase
MTDYILSHDIGTTGDKASLVDRDLRIAGSAFQGYSTRFLPGGIAEQDGEDWWGAVCATTHEVLSTAGVSAARIACITFSGQMMGCLPVDGKNMPLRPAMTWADSRSIAQADHLRETMGGDEEVYRLTGQKAAPTFTGAKILWIKENEADVFRKVAKFCICKDFVIARMSGVWVTDPSDASGTNLFDLRRGAWSDAILDALGLDAVLLPEVCPATSIVARISPSASRELGLLSGTPVVQGGGDGECAAVGAGAVSVGDAYLNLGSSGWLAGVTSWPIEDPKMRFSNEAHVVPGLFSPNGTTQNCGSTYAWLHQAMALLDPKLTFADMDRIASSSSPGGRGLLFLPYLLGERTPFLDPLARGGLLGLSSHHRLGDVLRAVLEGISINFALIDKALRENGLDYNELHVIGGGAVSELWLSILANVLNVSLVVTSAPLGASSLGAAICGGVGVGIWPDFGVANRDSPRRARVQPDSQLVGFYQNLVREFQEAYESTRALNRELAGLGAIPPLNRMVS